MNNALLMGVLDSLTHVQEQREPLFDGELMLVAMFGDGRAIDIFHDEVGTLAWCQTRIVDTRHVGMVHQGQGLAFGLETGDNSR